MEDVVEALSSHAAEWAALSKGDKDALLHSAWKKLKQVDWDEMGRGAARVEGFNLESTPGVNYANFRGLIDYGVMNSAFSWRLNTNKVKSSTCQGHTVLRLPGPSWMEPAHEVWLKKGKSLEPKPRARKGSQDRVAVVLGAGNQTFLSLTDCLSMLYDEDSVCVLKLHPLRAYAQSAFSVILSDFIARGFFRVVNCDLEETNQLIQDPRVSHVHMTGGKATHDAIVWGSGSTVESRSPSTRKLQKTMTSELGCVTPYIVSSGAVWSDKEIEYQAQCLVGPAIGNAGCNCLSPKILILDRDWPQRSVFLAAVRKAMDEAVIVPAYYPGALQRYNAYKAQYENDASCKISFLGKKEGKSARASGKRDAFYAAPSADLLPYMLIEIDDAQAKGINRYAFTNEPFAPVLTCVGLSGGNSAKAFLEKAVAFANDQCFGTLSAMLVLHPKVDAEAGDQAIASLRYGHVVVNGWSALGFTAYWGGHHSEDIMDTQSGIGYANQVMDVDPALIEKSVTRVAFTSVLQAAQKSGDDLPFAGWTPNQTAQVRDLVVRPGIMNALRVLWRKGGRPEDAVPSLASQVRV